MDVRAIIGRQRALFEDDVASHAELINGELRGARVLLFGGAGSIGKEVAIQLFRRNPAALHIIDISENNLVEVVRELRSSIGHNSTDTRFLPIDMGAIETSAFLASQPPYQYVLNLAAMKHVRSEKDEFSLMRMIKVNVLDTLATLNQARSCGAKKYFAVSTDKAKNPANLMGATKRIMEDILFEDDSATQVSTARFANVAFSDGSLLHGFRQRLLRHQPLSAPRDVRRYFLTGEEAGRLCLTSLLLGNQREVFFPKAGGDLDPLTFSEIAARFLAAHGYDAVETESEDEARCRAKELITAGKWPCYFFESDTAGEKPLEEFYSDSDMVDWKRLHDIGVINVPALTETERRRTETFLATVRGLREVGRWTKDDLVGAIRQACPTLAYIANDRTLDNKM